MFKPKYRIDDIIVGRTYHLGDNLANTNVMIKIESATYSAISGQWVYQGKVVTSNNKYVSVEVYEIDIKWKR